MSVRNRRFPAIVLVTSVAFGSACSHPGGPAPASAAVSPTKSARGTAESKEDNVAVEFLVNPDSPKPKLDESQEFTPASPRSTPLPEYPPNALAGGGPSAVVAVRLVLEAGAVREVKDSPKLAPYIGPFAAEFRQAVEAAVKRRAFTSARIDTLGPARPDMPERPLIATRYVPTFLDFAFRFSVVDGKGFVTVGSEKPETAPSTLPERIK